VEIKHIIVHRIIKEVNTLTTPQYGKSELENKSQPVLDLVNGISNAYTTNKTYGSFHGDTKNYPVKSWLTNYLDSDSNSTFMLFSTDVLNRIVEEMKVKSFSTGGYFIFAHYKMSDEHMLIAVVKSKDGLIFDEELKPKDTKTLDLDKLHQAVNINITRLELGEKSHLNFLGGKGYKRDVVEYFTKSIGCDEIISSKNATQNVLKLITDICHSTDMHPSKQKIIKNDIINLMEANHDNIYLQTINDRLNTHLDEQFHNKFIVAANSEDCRVSSFFQPHRLTLNSYKRIKIGTDKWALNFERGLLGRVEDDTPIAWNGEHLIFKKISEGYKSQINQTLAENSEIENE